MLPEGTASPAQCSVRRRGVRNAGLRAGAGGLRRCFGGRAAAAPDAGDAHAPRRNARGLCQPSQRQVEAHDGNDPAVRDEVLARLQPFQQDSRLRRCRAEFAVCFVVQRCTPRLLMVPLRVGRTCPQSAALGIDPSPIGGIRTYAPYPHRQLREALPALASREPWGRGLCLTSGSSRLINAQATHIS